MTDSYEYKNKIHEENLRSARAAHEQHRSDSADLFKSVLSFADSALKSAAILNGGAALAMMALIGGVVTSKVSVKPIVDAMTAFGGGLLLATLATGASYVTQYLYQVSHHKFELTWEHPYVVETEASKRESRNGIVWHVLALVLVISSYGAFVVGGFSVRSWALAANGAVEVATPSLLPSPANQTSVATKGDAPAHEVHGDAAAPLVASDGKKQ